MSNKIKDGSDHFTMGPIRVQKYFAEGDDEIMKLEILMPKRFRAKGRLKRLLLENYSTAVISLDEHNDKYLNVTLTDISLACDEEVPE